MTGDCPIRILGDLLRIYCTTILECLDLEVRLVMDLPHESLIHEAPRRAPCVTEQIAKSLKAKMNLQVYFIRKAGYGPQSL